MTEFIARYKQQNEDFGHARIPLDSDEEEELKPAAKSMVTSTSLKKSNFPQVDTLILDGGCDTCSIGGNAWVMDYTTNKYVSVTGFSKNSKLQEIQLKLGEL